MKANWHLEDVPVDSSDPFATPSGRVHRVDLSDPVVLRAKLTALLLIEGRLADRGMTCTLKDRPDSCCAACPLRGSSRVQRIRRLCNIGLEQERTLMSMLADDV